MLSVARRRARYARPRKVRHLSDGVKKSGRTNLVNLVAPKEKVHRIADLPNVLVVKHHGHAQR